MNFRIADTFTDSHGSWSKPRLFNLLSPVRKIEVRADCGGPSLHEYIEENSSYMAD